MTKIPGTKVLPFIMTAMVYCCCQVELHAQGVLLRGIGAVNESMGGTSIAAPIDAAGATFANPASISGLKNCEIGFNFGVLFPGTSVTSEIPGMIPPVTSRGDSGQTPLPTMSMIYRPHNDSRLTCGLTVSGVGGASALYHSTGSPFINPILAGTTWTANVQIYQILPTLAFQATKRLSFGVSPTISLAALQMNPMVLGSTLDNPMFNYGTKYTWGCGVNIGAYYDFNERFRAGFTYKSPVWTSPMEFSGTDLISMNPLQTSTRFDLPMILGAGLSYTCRNERLLLACDVKYYDYGHVNGFGDDVLDHNGRVSGLGWKSILAISAGVQYKVTDRFRIRAGYCFNENPIPDVNQYANVGTPLFTQHTISMGASLTLPRNVELHATYSHALESKKTGMFALGGIVGSVTNTVHAHSASFGISKRF